MAYNSTIPAIAQAYQNDPRTRLAAAMLSTGSSTAPVAQGGWAVTDGLARAAQAIAGGFVERGQQRKYEKREQDYMQAMRDAAAVASAPQSQPAIANPAEQAQQAAAAALVPPQQPLPLQTSGQGVPQPLQAIDPGAGTSPQAPPLASLTPPTAPPPQVAAAPRPQPMQAQTPPRQQYSASDYYRNGIVPIEGGTGPNGEFLTSPKGAIGPGQVMPGTAPEAARLAGVPFDDRRYRTDPEYNNLLGEAYYTEQLRTFGDPVKAAAAYNAGPGRVRRAMRRASREGGDWIQYLPAETQGYVTNFRERVAGGTSGGSQVEAVGAVPVAPPQYEDVPQAPTMRGLDQRPQAPELPQEVQSNRIAIAQQLLNSGNPDLAAFAQDYLDKGLGEQYEARTLRAQQEYGQKQAGYASELGDYNDERSQGRQFGYNQVSDAQSRNFTRETGYVDRSFQAGENAANREQEARMANQQQSWQSYENALERAHDAEQGGLDRGASSTPILDTATGLKIQDQARQEMDKNEATIAMVERFLQLNESQGTGGWLLGTGTGRSMAGFTDEQVREMNGLANQIVLGTLGGLGVAISDGDRNFVSDSTVSAGAPRISNINRGRAVIGVMRRQNEHAYEWQRAQMQGRQLDFLDSWEAFRKSVPAFRSGRNGMIEINPMTYQQWVASRTYDANGNRAQ